MADAYIGEIRIFPYRYAPSGWLECNGQVLSVRDYQPLYAVIRNIYGGTPGTNFMLPNLLGRVPVGMGQGPGLSLYNLGQQTGSMSVQITTATMPAHTHTVSSRLGKNDTTRQGNAVFLSDPTDVNLGVPMSRPDSTQNYQLYSGFTSQPAAYMAQTALSQTGGSITHANQQSYLAFRFCICIDGIFPVSE